MHSQNWDTASVSWSTVESWQQDGLLSQWPKIRNNQSSRRSILFFKHYSNAAPIIDQTAQHAAVFCYIINYYSVSALLILHRASIRHLCWENSTRLNSLNTYSEHYVEKKPLRPWSWILAEPRCIFQLLNRYKQTQIHEYLKGRRLHWSKHKTHKHFQRWAI